MIVEKFQQLGGTDVSYADIAKRAWEIGRAGLATKVGLVIIQTVIVSHTAFTAPRPRDQGFRSGAPVIDDEGRSLGPGQSR
jgi:hypothetical protein